MPDWAEPAATPADVPDWDRRHADALVPFRIDWQGRPLNPHGRTGRTGRNLGKWGENPAADPIVVAGYGQERRVLLITRSDIGVEAIPGGMTDPGETAPDTLVRELREETGVDLRDRTPVVLGRDLVNDWRNTDHAWVASTSALFQLDATVPAIGADDALDANWWPFGYLNALDSAVTAAGRTLYNAHRPLLQRALDHLARTATTPPASIAELIARHATNLATLTEEPLATTGSALIDQLREAEDRLDQVGIPGSRRPGHRSRAARPCARRGARQREAAGAAGARRPRRGPAARARGHDRRVPRHGLTRAPPEPTPDRCPPRPGRAAAHPDRPHTPLARRFRMTELICYPPMPEHRLVVLIGSFGAGKSTIARSWPASQVLSLDALHKVVSDDFSVKFSVLR